MLSDLTGGGACTECRLTVIYRRTRIIRAFHADFIRSHLTRRVAWPSNTVCRTRRLVYPRVQHCSWCTNHAGSVSEPAEGRIRGLDIALTKLGSVELAGPGF